MDKVSPDESAAPSGDAAPQVVLAASDHSRVPKPDVTESQIEALTEANQALALDLYRHLAESSEANLFFSPHSISVALAMTYAGARGTTAEEMADTLHFTLPQDSLHAAFNALDQQLSQRGADAEGKDGEGFRLHIVNALWGQQDYEFEPTFLDTLAENYGAGLRLVDFVEQTEAARRLINEWVAEQTEGRIEDLIPEGALDTMTRLVLTNAIYFNAAWAEPFEESATHDDVFHRLDESTVDVPMMRQTTSFGYASGTDYEAVELPYDGQELSMVVIVPTMGTFEAFETTLDAARLDDVLESLERHRVALAMPKFEMTAKFNLNDTLSQMGMPQAFSSEADFSGMTGDRELFLSNVIHQAFVTVDEAGTEAAAATAATMSLTAAMPEETIEMKVDRPFIYVIRDIQTGGLLFVGRVLDPSAR